ncbi:unnamed protein product [Urochloa humidicola]
MGDLVPRLVHEYKMQGPRKPMQELMRRMQPWMDAWEQAAQDRVDKQALYDPTSYHVYLQWYAPRTRTRLVSMKQRPEQATVPHALLYPGHVGWALHQAADLGMEMERDAGQAIALQATQEITEDAEVVPFGPAAQRQEIRPRERFSPVDYERPRAPASARRPKRARGVRGQPGAGP